MKRIQTVLVSIGILAATACTNTSMADDDASNIEGEVLARFESLAASAQKADHSEYLAHFDREQFTALNADGTVTHGFADFSAAFTAGAQGIARYHSLDFENVKVSVLPPSTAILVNEYSAEIELVSGDVVTVAGAGTQVWHKSDNEWMLSHVSSSTKP